ncbi:MAG: hypothetical protein ACHQX4_09740 [Gemmatimonadales bacterium]
MNAFKRMTVVALASVAVVPAIRAQVPGMPLFTNPRYATGLRVHADIGQPTDKGTSLGDLTVIQGGANFVLGPIGIDASVGTLRNNIQALQTCTAGAPANCNTNSKLTASALAQLRIMGGGPSNLSLSVFGGASTDLTAYDALDCSSFTTVTTPTLAQCQAQKAALTVKQLNIPVGAALGLRIPLGLASLNLWGSARENFTSFANCNGTCPSAGSGKVRFAFGADLPVFRILSVRAAYDTGKDINDQTTSVWGVGASIGIGGMR